ncbi:hypothetical protein NESM_000592600 [Novymonas esmeraldas]|uniref:Membrane-associated protein n=1 Tax=Novymonas esmeraldas TaxID=1808958 RepID=A0AAW0ESE7_9TRYP
MTALRADMVYHTTSPTTAHYGDARWPLRRRRPQHRRTLSRVAAAALMLACGCALGANAVVDVLASVPNAFQSTGTSVRAVYDAAQLTSANFTSESMQPFHSSAYVLCNSTAVDGSGGGGSSETQTIARAWCSARSHGVRVNQSVWWRTLAPPGLQPRTSSAPGSVGEDAWNCITFGCDGEYAIAASASVATDAVGGLGVSGPCCGSTNATFVLYMTRGIVVQAATLPVAALNVEAAALFRAFTSMESRPAPSGSSSSRSSSSSTVAGHASSPPPASGAALTASSTLPMDYCLVRQLPPYLYADSTRSTAGDGGILFAVNASICGADLSDRIDVRQATLLMNGYTVVLATADGVEGLSFPRELIVSIASWLASSHDSAAAGSGGVVQSVLRTKNICTWGSSASQATAYRTGEYLDCVVDPTTIASLPPLVLTVRNESIVSTADTNNTCAIALQLSSCLQRDGNTLRFHSTGSLAAEREQHQHSMTSFREPVIVVGVQQLRGATVAVTRHALIARWAANAVDAGFGLPLVYLAVPRGTAVAAAAHAAGAACASRAVCGARQSWYPSLNGCVSVSCTHVFLYYFDPDTLSCTPRSSIVSVFAGMCAALVVAEGVVLHLRRRAERVKEDHMRLVLQVQRRHTQVQ